MRRLLAIAFAALGLAVAAPLATAMAQDKIRLAVTDIEGLEALQREYGPFSKALSDLTGLAVELFPVSSRTVGVEGMSARQIDFALVGPAEYVVFKARADARPVVMWTRPDYFSQVVVLANGPVKSLDDLKGKTISFGEIGSTSQHLGPAQALADLGLKYNTDYRPTFLNRNVAVEAMIRGDIAAVGMNFTHLQNIRRRFPGVAFLVLARGRDLPNDLLVAGPHVADPIIARVRDAFAKSGDKLMAEVLKGDDAKKYSGGVFLPTVNDRDYDYVRAMYRTLGIAEFTRFIQ